MPKNVLILKFPYSSTFGGGEKHTLTLVEHLKERGWKFFLVSSCPVLLEKFRMNQWSAHKLLLGKEPVTAGALLFFILFSPIIFVILTLIILYHRIFRRVKTVFCLSLAEKVLITPLSRLLGIRVIWMEHVAAGRWIRSNPLRLLYVGFSHLATVVVISKNIETTLLALGVPKKSLRMVYPGIPLNEWSVPSKHLDDPTKAYTIGFIGRLEPEKGVGVLLQAIANVAEVLPQIRGIIIGSGSEKRSLEWLNRKLNLEDLVRFVGFQTGLPRWLSHFHVLALPSVKRESFGAILIEALAAKVPVVGSNLGGIPEIIEAGKTGYLVKPGSVTDLADTLIHIYHHYTEALEFARNGSEKVAREFRLEDMLKAFEDIL